MKKSKLFLMTLLMAIVMMAMNPARLWADEVTITALSGNPNSENEGYAKLLDGNTSTKWCSEAIDCYVIFKLSESKAISGYTLYDGNDTNKFPGRHWSEWIIYGANFSSDEAARENAKEWTAIDHRSDIRYTGENQTFTISGAAAYKYYKILIYEVGVTEHFYKEGGEDEDEGEGEFIEEEGAQQMAEVQFTWAAADSGEGGGETTLPALNVGESQVNIGEGETATYSFTPTESGAYRFYSEGNGVDLELSNIVLGEEGITIFEEADIDANDKNFYNIVALTAGNTYTVSIKCKEGTAQNYKVAIQKKDYSVFTYTATSDMSASFDNDHYDTYCDTWKDGSTPVTVIVKGKVVKINEGKFKDCTAFTSIILPSGLEYIHESFNGCTNLASITLPSSLAEIKESFNSTNLASISCPSSLTEIYYSFGDCDNLNNVHLSSIPQIDGNQFQGGIINVNLTDDSYVAEDKGDYPEYSGITYTREMSNQWGTVVLPFVLNYNANNGNYKLYHLTKATDEALTFIENNDEDLINPGTPMVIKALDKTWNSDLGKYVVTIEEIAYGLGTEINTTDDVDGLSMKGTFNETTIGGTEGNGVYFIANNEFWRADAKTTVKPFRGWFEFSSGSGAKSFDIVVEENGENTAIGVLNAENLELRDGKFLENNRIVIVKNGKKYNLNGQEVK